MFDLEDITDIDIKYDRLDKTSAIVLPTSTTHGMVIGRDRYLPNNLIIALVGRYSGRYPGPNIKALNSFTPDEAQQIALTLLHLIRRPHGSN
jgi:hypothetical protein